MSKTIIYLLVSIVSVNALLHESKYYMNKFATFEKEYGKKYLNEEESEYKYKTKIKLERDCKYFL